MEKSRLKLERYKDWKESSQAKKRVCSPNFSGDRTQDTNETKGKKTTTTTTKNRKKKNPKKNHNTNTTRKGNQQGGGTPKKKTELGSSSCD